MKRIEKPWGYEIIFADTSHYAAKLLLIHKGKRLSLQYHRQKEESLYLHEGRLLFYRSASDDKEDGEEVEMLAGEARTIPAGERHRLTALEECVVFEVSTPHLDDVVRLEDDYGRVENKDA